MPYIPELPIPAPHPIDPATHTMLNAVRRVLCAALPIVRCLDDNLWRDLNRALRSTERALVAREEDQT